MVSSIIYENYYTGGFMVSQAQDRLSFDSGTIANTGTADVLLQAGLVLSRAAGTPAASPGVGNTGNGTVGSISGGVAVQIGVYTLIATGATTFDVLDPTGVSLGVATAGTGFVSPEIDLTVTAGATAFVAGDSFRIDVPAGGYQSYTGAAGAPASAILYDLVTVPAGGSKTVAAIARQAEVNRKELNWDASITNAGTVMAAAETAAIDQLAKRGIIAR